MHIHIHLFVLHIDFLLEMDHENSSGSCITNKRIPGLFGGVIVTILAKFY